LARVLAGQETAGLLSALTGTVATVAAVGPLLVVTGPFNSNAFQLLAVVAFGHLGTAALFIFGGARSEGDDQQATASSDSPLTRPSALVVLLAPVAGALFVYVGVETVFAGWSAVIPAGALGLNASTAALGTSAFWILMATGRYAACLILKSAVRPRTLLLAICAAASACFAVAGLFRYANPGAAVFAAGGAVLCLGPMYSLILGIGLIRVTVQDAKKAVGLLVACGAAGGSFVPATVLAVTADPSAPAVFWSAAVLTAVVATLVLIPAHVEPAAVISTSSPAPTSGEQRGM
jgi:fucose permease